MLSIGFSWLFMGILVFLMGTAILQGFQYVMQCVGEDTSKMQPVPGHVLFLGIMGCTLYAQVFSLFGGVSREAVLLLGLLAAAYGIAGRNYIKVLVRTWKADRPDLLPKRKQKDRKWEEKLEWFLPWILILTAAVVYAAASAGTVKLIDTDWYHAQTIRWIEEYGCVKGVANLFPSLGYNNAQHYFDALFSMKWLAGQSLRSSGGFFGLAVLIHGVMRIARWRKHSRHMADMLAVWEIGYSIIVTAFFTEPYVDTLPNALVLLVMTEWMALLEEEKYDTASMILNCLLAVFAAVCKMSVAPVVLLALHPALLLLRQKKWKEILACLGLGFGIVLPFLITNVITTGYLVYLLSAVDLFPVAWKMDPEILKYAVDSMIAFARMPLASMEEALNAGWSWIPVWFKAESISHQYLYLLILLMVCYDLGSVGIRLGKTRRSGQSTWRETVDLPLLWPRICTYLGLAYWFVTIPQVKYCWSFLIIPIAVTPVYYLEACHRRQEEERKAKIRNHGSVSEHAADAGSEEAGEVYDLEEEGEGVFLPLNADGGFLPRCFMIASICTICMYAGFYSLRTLGYMKEGVLHYPVLQADYQSYDFEKIIIDGHDFYIRKDGGDIACGYHVFPYLDSPENRDRLIVGESLGDGFSLRSLSGEGDASDETE